MTQLYREALIRLRLKKAKASYSDTNRLIDLEKVLNYYFYRWIAYLVQATCRYHLPSIVSRVVVFNVLVN